MKKHISLIVALALILSFTPLGLNDNNFTENNTEPYNYDISTSVAEAGTSISAPKISSIAPISSKAVIVSWNKVSGAKNYKVYRATSKSGTYKQIKSTTATKYINNGLVADKTYYYKIVAVGKTSNSKFSGYRSVKTKDNTTVSLSSVPAYSGEAYTEVNGNMPYFTDAQKKLPVFEFYSSLDSKRRCGTAIAMIGKSLMPTEERGSIGSVRPSGWQTIRYDNIVDGKYLYNRCHLIGFQLAGENANEKNLVTGTRYMNVDGMLPFEDEVADYVKSTGKKVLYRVTPLFDGNDLVCKGVEMEAYSVADGGKSICFNVFVYNVQPGITINYSNGSSYADNGDIGQTAEQNGETAKTSSTFIINTNTGKFHYPDCSSVKRMSEANKKTSHESAKTLKSKGYSPCGNCNPS